MFLVARRESGFTLIEIMVVLVIIAILSALIGPQILGRVDEARVTAAGQDIQTLGARFLSHGQLQVSDHGPGPRGPGQEAGRPERAQLAP
jgi:prepilin-type N-terminal cleavage/methylation domain-containing protein